MILLVFNITQMRTLEGSVSLTWHVALAMDSVYHLWMLI